MQIGLIDVDNIGKDNPFPNIPLMKISTWHKDWGDEVEWHQPGKHYDIVYMSKVFSFTPDYEDEIDADRIIKGGSGYAIEIIDGLEVYHKELDPHLPDEIEEVFPDYELYGITDTAYGFLTRGCPRACSFCHVEKMQGRKTHRVARLSDFWNGQKRIVLLDPNITACHDWKDLLQELADSKAEVDFCQGIDIRTMTPEKADALGRIKIKKIHFAWDRYQDKEIIKKRLTEFKEITGYGRNKVSVYVLTNFDTTFEQDLERILFIRSLNFQPYVMRYDREHIPRGHVQNNLARWVNFPALFWRYETFEDYKKYNRKDKKRKGEK